MKLLLLALCWLSTIEAARLNLKGGGAVKGSTRKGANSRQRHRRNLQEYGPEVEMYDTYYDHYADTVVASARKKGGHSSGTPGRGGGKGKKSSSSKKGGKEADDYYYDAVFWS